MIPAGEVLRCVDAVRPEIDVAALSVGRPDGRYFAGRRLLPWMTSDETRRLAALHYRYHHLRAPWVEAAMQAEYDALSHRYASTSVVVSWWIEDGQPGLPTVLQNDSNELGEPTLARCFAWDRGSSLTHAIITACAPRENSNDYYDAVMDKFTRELGDTWCLAAADIQVFVATLRFRRDLHAAEEAGVRIEAEVAKLSGPELRE